MSTAHAMDRARARYSEALAAMPLKRDRLFAVRWHEVRRGTVKPRAENILASGHHDACCLATGLAVFPGRHEAEAGILSFEPVKPGLTRGRIFVGEYYDPTDPPA